MALIIEMQAQGGPEVLVPVDCEVPSAGVGQVLVRQTAIGVNYLDVYLRNGDMPVGSFPFVDGFEAAGVIEALGEGVSGFEIGQRVAYQLVGGAYAQMRVMAPDRLVALPDGINDALAAAIMLKGTTAEMLVRHVHRVQAGDVVVVHAASGGVGSLVTQWTHALGATVIGTVGSASKRDAAIANGCDYVVVNAEEDFVEAVQRITNGIGATVVYDGVGASTFLRNFDALGKFGKAVLFGWASGRVTPVDVHMLNAKSLSIVNPSIGHYTASRAQLEASAEALFAAIEDGFLKVTPQTYPLREAARAHADLEARKTVGPVVLIP